MSLPTEQWLYLLNPKREDKRSQVLMEDLEKEGREFVSALRKLVEKELSVLAVDAQQQADMYWATNKSAREEAGKDEQGRIGTRVRIIGSTLVAEWYQNRFVEQGPDATKMKVFSTHIKKGRSTAYNMAHFKREPQWSREVIKLVEERYALLRQRANALSKIRRACSEYERLLDKSYSQEEV